MESKYQLIVKVSRGLVVRDRPAPDSQGARKMRAEPIGKILIAYTIINVDGVEYAGLIPQNPLKPEWVRVAEADHSIEYVEVIPLGESANQQISEGAVMRLADAVENMAEAIWALSKVKNGTS
jgi:hypothetical protein